MLGAVATKTLARIIQAGGMTDREVAARGKALVKGARETPEQMRVQVPALGMRVKREAVKDYEWLIYEKGATNKDIINSSSRPNCDIDGLLSNFEEWLRR